ncbi:MAG: phosphatase PAP2 family protein [Pseudomonadota bacterium]
MRRARRLGVVALLAASALASPVVGAAEPSAPDPESVYHVSLGVDGAVILAGAVGSLLPYALSSHLIHVSCPCPASSVNSFDRGVIGNASDGADVASSVTLGLALVGPPVADWLALRHRRVWLEDAVVFAEAVSVNGAFVTLAKYAVQRPIPRVYSDPAAAADAGNYRSFYSGHTSNAFAALSTAAVTMNARYGLTWQPWVATLLIGGSVAVERVLAGYHFYTDVLMGAAAGTVVGTGIAVLHLRAPRVRVSLFRSIGGGGAGIALGGPM